MLAPTCDHFMLNLHVSTRAEAPLFTILILKPSTNITAREVRAFLSIGLQSSCSCLINSLL